MQNAFVNVYKENHKTTTAELCNLTFFQRKLYDKIEKEVLHNTSLNKFVG